MQEFDRRFAEGVYTTLNPHGTGWHELSGPVLLEHIGGQIGHLYEATFQSALDFHFLVCFALDALREHPDAESIRELHRYVRLGGSVLNNFAYGSMISQWDRSLFYDVAEQTDDLMEQFLGAPTK